MSSLREKIITPTVVRIFAVIGFIATLVILVIVISLVRLEYAAPSEPDNVIVTFDLDQPVVEQNDSSPLELVTHEQTASFLDILRAIDRAKADPHVKGIVANFGGSQPPFAMAQELHRAFAHFRESGKFSYAFGSTYGDFGNGNRAYFVASAFDNIWLQPVGAVSLSGVAIETPFAKQALDKIGVTGNFLRREEYKSVMESFMRDDYSPPVRANMQSMIDDLFNQTAAGIAEGRKWDVAKVKKLMDGGPYTADEALKQGLVTHIGYANDLEDELKKKAGDDVEHVAFQDYLAYGGGLKKSGANTRVALIFGTGLITDHATGPADIGGGEIMGADKVADAFNDAADDKDIKAIIFRIDSPGGSPGASETIRAALMHAQKSGKPVFISMGGVAASGGYWVAMNGDRIIAEPGTLTGSIGVVAGKFVLGGLMQKLGISWGTLTTGGNAGLWSVTQEFTPAQLERMNTFLDETYKDFVTDVATARKIPIEKMPEIAKGRVFTGAQAVKAGLVDELGGYDITLAAVRKKLNLTPEDVLALEQFPAPLTPAERVIKILKGIGIEGAMLRSSLAQWQNMQALLRPIMGEAISLAQTRGPILLAHKPGIE